MEQNLSCNIQDCGVQLTTHAVVTVCSHVLCLRCANSHGFGGQAPYKCPVCTQSLNASEVCEQLLQPSEEWKSVALSGLSPTVVMECAGRALGFWSYQMTNQISYQLRKHSKLKEYCAELQGEIENIWGQANQRIITLTTKIRDMEREEHSLKRQCEGLRLALESRSRELAQFQELYSKLKQRVLHGQAQEVPPSVLRSRTPIRAPGAAPESHNRTQPQLGRPTMPASVRTEIPNYFPASPGFPETQPRSEALVEWNTPEIPQQIPATPGSHLPLRNPTSLSYVPSPRTGVGRAVATLGPGRQHQTARASQSNITAGPVRGFSRTGPGVTSQIGHPLGDSSLNVAKPLQETIEAISGTPSNLPQVTRSTTQHFESSGQILRRR